MNGPNQVSAFLARLSELSGSQSRDPNLGMRRRHESYVKIHLQARTFPGNAFIYVGDSYNLDRAIIPGFAEGKRRSVVALLLERKGHHQGCVRVEDALAFDGFSEVLSRFERDMLGNLCADDMIGPAFDADGRRILESFCLWRALRPQEVPVRTLVPA